MADFFPSITPYSYAHNDPVSYIDFAGLGPIKDWWRKRKKIRTRRRNIRNSRKPGCMSKRDRVKHRTGRNNGGGGRKKSGGQNNNEDRPTISIDIIGSIGFDGLGNNNNFPDIGQIDYTPPSPPPFRPTIITDIGEIEKGGKITFTRQIKYNRLSPVIDPSSADNQRFLQQILDILIQKESLHLEIYGNVEGNPKGKLAPVVKSFMSNRARSVKAFLESNGIDSKRLKARVGSAYSDKKRGYSTSFNLVYPK